MKSIKFFTYLAVLGCLATSALAACSGDSGESGDTPTGEVAEYMNELKKTSQANHLYYHYFRYSNNAKAYEPWDVWAWAYKPTASEGVKFDWEGRTQSADHLSATGDATIGKLGGAYVDIDLGKTYEGGWNDIKKTIGGVKNISFSGAKQVGLQIVQSSTRIQKDTEFWNNDGSNLYIKLSDYELDLEGGGKAYHCFVVQDDVQNPSKYPVADINDPFKDDDGKNVTYGDDKYNNVKWSTTPAHKNTAADFKNIGVGYQIMVSSFADSDGDGFGDIYGITQKLDYLETLGVKALWLTPIQLSDSYHGYDITDYSKVDPKFGSSQSPAAQANNGVVTEETALEDYKALIAAAHDKGIKIVMDLVLNHTSTSNKWFVKSANLDADLRGYYQWGNHETNKSKINQKNNWYPYGDHCYSYYAKFGSSMPELNFSYQATRDAVIDMSVYWVKDIGVDGFRLDAIKHIFMENEVSSTKGDTIVYDKSDSGDYSSDLTKNLHFFRDLKASVTQKAGRDVFFVGENFDGSAYQVAPYYDAFDSLFDFYSYFNLTSAAATGRYNTDNKFGTAAGYLRNNSPFSVKEQSDKGTLRDTHGDYAKADGHQWNFPEIYKVYNSYRGDTSLPGAFTSNHDIARVINRIAGTGTAEGLQKQGTITTSNWADFEKSADCVKFAEILLPGTTWVYYGDEIGMTGNFPSGKDDKSSYADLWYRQPMKWTTTGGKKGDNYGTTDYYVTGSNMKVEQDKVNASATVKGALNAEGKFDTTNIELTKIKEFIDLKNSNTDAGKALRLGDFVAGDFATGDSMVANVLQFSRTLNGKTVCVAVNFNKSKTLPLNGMTGSNSISYNGATKTSLPPYSVIVTY